MVLVSLILLGMTFFTSERIRSAVKSQIPLQILTILNSESGKINASMRGYEQTLSYLTRLNSTIQFLSWIEQAPDEAQMIEQWRQVLKAPVAGLLTKSEEVQINDIIDIAILDANEQTVFRLVTNGREPGKEEPPYEKFINGKMRDTMEAEGIFRSQVFFQMNADDYKERVIYLFKPVYYQRKKIGTITMAISLETLFENVPGALANVGGKTSVISSEYSQNGFYLAHSDSENS